VTETTIRAEDVLPVRSRISWGAIFAGAMVALAVYVVLGLLGLAVGFSVSGSARGEQPSVGAGIWAVVCTLLALFVGGAVCSQFTAGENRLEAAMYGLVLWGVVFTVLVSSAFGVSRLGFNALFGVAVTSERGSGWTRADVQRLGEQAGLSQEQIDKMQRGLGMSAEEWRASTNDPAMRQHAIAAAWWSFFGTLVSMLAAILGALCGSGPTLRLQRFLNPRVRTEQTVITTGR
jgi:hypothetical protein